MVKELDCDEWGLKVQVPQESLELGCLFVPLNKETSLFMINAFECTLSRWLCVNVFLTHSVHIKTSQAT